MTYTESGSLNAGTVSLIGASTGSAPANSVPVGWEHNLKLTLPNFFARDSKWGSGSWHIPALQGCTSLPGEVVVSAGTGSNSMGMLTVLPRCCVRGARL